MLPTAGWQGAGPATTASATPRYHAGLPVNVLLMLNDLPPITKALLWSNALVFVLQLLLGEPLFRAFMLWPLGSYPLGFQNGELLTAGFLPWQLVTYGFLHGSPGHLFFNMLAVYMFGSQIEQVWGPRRYATYFFVCVVGAGLIQLAVATWSVSSGGAPYPTLGASGGVYGLLLAYGMMFPNRQVMLLIPPIPMKARTLVIVFGAIELFLGVTGTQSGVAHFAHLGGMLFGFLLIQHWRGRWPFGPTRRD
jgi:membrane associated rhomboid family serine protease